MSYTHVKNDFSNKENVINNLKLIFKLTFLGRSSLKWNDLYFDEILKPELIFNFLGTTDLKYQQIDHIIPKSLFNWNILNEISYCCIPENHQYLRADRNNSKSNKIIFSKNTCPVVLLPLYDIIERNYFTPPNYLKNIKKENEPVISDPFYYDPTGMTLEEKIIKESDIILEKMKLGMIK